MDQQAHLGRTTSSAAGQGQHNHQLDINQQGVHSASPDPYAATGVSTAALSLGLDQAQPPQQPQAFAGAATEPPPPFDAVGATADFLGDPQNQRPQPYPQPAGPDPAAAAFDPSAAFGREPPAVAAAAQAPVSFDTQPQSQAAASYLSPNLHDGDFSLFPSSGGQGDQLQPPLLERPSLSPNELNTMASPQSHHSPTPPNPQGHQPGSAQHSPAFSQQQFSSPPGSHSRNASLGPEAALLPSQMGDWSQPQFQRHRRTPSEYSDVSSVSPSPNIVSADTFDEHGSHSPLQRASDGNLYQDVLGFGNFSITDADPGQHGRSPSHSPAISPRIQPQDPPEMGSAAYGLTSSGAGFGTYLGMQLSGDMFPSMQTSCGAEASQMAPPAINIDFAPNKPGSYELSKTHMDQDSLTPPDRGRSKLQLKRPRSITDPFRPGGATLARPNDTGSLSPSAASDLASRPESARSLSPLDRQATASRRRQSTSAVPNNVIALRLADPEYQNSQDIGTSKRVQKHPATFQCTLCPKRFTRAYNLRSHLRTHTDERPFVCTVCGKAFARQHDRKRHESLHSGQKKFICKGDLKASGQWGCGRRFARADALGRHFRSEAGRICIKPLLDEEMIERQREWQEQNVQQHNMAQNLAAPQPMVMDTPAGYPMDAGGNYALPAALLAQYPALAQMNWSQPDSGGGIDDELSGRSSFDASDYEEADDGGYVSGSGAGYGEAGFESKFGEMGYAGGFDGR